MSVHVAITERSKMVSVQNKNSVKHVICNVADAFFFPDACIEASANQLTHY